MKSESAAANASVENENEDPSPACRPISTASAISPCAARPISKTIKKRAAREKEDAIKYANSSLLERLLPIVDNFDLGLAAAKAEGEESPIFAGMSLVLKQLNDFLADNGLQPIDAVGKKFDPNLHEAIAHEPSETVPEEHRHPANPPRLQASRIGSCGLPAWSSPAARLGT